MYFLYGAIIAIVIHYGFKFGSVLFWSNDNIKYKELFTAVIRIAILSMLNVWKQY